MNLIDELTWRGMIYDHTPGTAEQLEKELTGGYIGFDPTAASLHIGNLATVMLLVHLQRSGHKPYALVGGATGMVGDPSGKSQERQLLSEEVLRHNQSCVKNQLERFLDFDCGDHSAVMVNNYDWFKEINFLEFLRDTGKHITVNYMMAKDSVKNRLETGISFTEFSYQLLQGYDFYHLYHHHGVKLQMGGSDQWGNIVTGTELIRRKAQGEAYALTTPLVTKADGSKFGKSEEGNVWLDPEMTSPYKFYQFWLNCADEDSRTLIRVFTLMGKEEIATIEAEHDTAPHTRALQQAIAKEVTTRVHGEAAYRLAVKASNVLFGRSVKQDLLDLDQSTFLSVFEGVNNVTISRATLDAASDVTELLSTATNGEIFKSKGEARKMIQGGGVSVNKEKLTDFSGDTNFDLLHEKYLLVQKGKKNYYLVEVES